MKRPLTNVVLGVGIFGALALYYIRMREERLAQEALSDALGTRVAVRTPGTVIWTENPDGTYELGAAQLVVASDDEDSTHYVHESGSMNESDYGFTVHK